LNHFALGSWIQPSSMSSWLVLVPNVPSTIWSSAPLEVIRSFVSSSISISYHGWTHMPLRHPIRTISAVFNPIPRHFWTVLALLWESLGSTNNILKGITSQIHLRTGAFFGTACSLWPLIAS
jgi:hypothetical protein